ncbi:discoidin domain-containing protein [Kineosporia babensis]|uniref:Discoidin domain-containing protein n=1 Tax=Kineosporia babensis TaxID=499548 RepID=A0A9X1STP7_9ACTN|nr:discoidin domain-containing protein [Kineosporia babensis]MCD5310780.1 discoidin domain-containing protein [Kineosporia babensis]
MRLDRRVLAACCAAALFTGGVATVTAAAEPAKVSVRSAVSPIGIPGRGATVPFQEIEAEDAATNGTVIGPDRVYGQLPSEASGRKAVTLDAVNEYVEFTLPAAANSMVLRYSLPDNAAGTGRDATVAVEAGGQKLTDLPLTSRYSWFYGGYPFTNTPGSNPHHFYDESRTLFGQTLAAGSKVRVKVTSTASSPTFTIDLADFEQVAAAGTAPAGALNIVTGYGADATGSADATSAVQRAVNDGAAQNKPVWIPKGTFKVTGHIIADRVTIAGAGPWHSVLTGDGVGIYGKYVADGGPSTGVTVKDLAVLGEVEDRNDSAQVNAFGGAMSNSSIDNVWMQHTKVGAWMDGPMTNFHIRNSRILDQTADGVNFHQGVTNSSVTNTFVRNTGDDGLAMWAERDDNVKNTFSRNTVVVPVLANNIAIYGGEDIAVTNNVVSDTVTNGGGIHVGNRYPGVQGNTAVQGTFDLSGNTLIRAGNSDYNWQFGVGAIWFNGLNEPIDATINVRDTDILDSSYSAISFIEGSVRGVNFENVKIDGAGTFALQIQAPGSATFKNVTATGIGYANPVYSCTGANFTINNAGGNGTWLNGTPYCGPWPSPVYGGGGPGPSPTATPTATPTVTPTQDPGTGNLAAGKPVQASSFTDVYQATNAVDGNASTYWESTNNAWPQTLTVDLGTSRQISRLVLKLPPPTAWEARTQTIAVSASANGQNFSSIKAAAQYRFDPAQANTVTIPVSSAQTRYLRLTFTANTAWPAAQLSELEAYPS